MIDDNTKDEINHRNMSQGEIEESKKSIEDIENEISDFLGSLVHKASNKIAQGIISNKSVWCTITSLHTTS